MIVRFPRVCVFFTDERTDMESKLVPESNENVFGIFRQRITDLNRAIIIGKLCQLEAVILVQLPKLFVL